MKVSAAGSLPLPSIKNSASFDASTSAISLKFSAQPTEPTAKPPEKGWGERAKDWFKSITNLFGRVSGLIDGGYQTTQILLHVRQWNKSLSEANPEKGLDERTIAIADLCYIAFRKGFHQAVDKQTPEKQELNGNAANYALLSSLLEQFPGLINSYKNLPGNVSLVEDWINSNPNSTAEDKTAQLRDLQEASKQFPLPLHHCTTLLERLPQTQAPV